MMHALLNQARANLYSLLDTRPRLVVRPVPVSYHTDTEEESSCLLDPDLWTFIEAWRRP